MKLFIFAFFLAVTNSFIQIKKIIIAKDINDINQLSYRTDLKGVNLIFDKNSKISLLPFYLFQQMKNHYNMIYNQCSPYDVELESGIFLLRCNSYENLKLDPIHLIFEEIGIKILKKYFFITHNEFIFYSKKEQENIIIGKDLMNLMKVNITIEKDKELISIGNKDFIFELDDI